MSYQREWDDPHNAAGFAAECARLALPFYKGDHKPDLVAAIEITERYASGEEIDAGVASIAYANAADAANASSTSTAAVSTDSAYAADASAYAADVVADIYVDICAAYTSAGYAADAAGISGVDISEIRVAFARWVVRDLSGGRELPEELRQAAGASVVAGDEALARELVGF